MQYYIAWYLLLVLYTFTMKKNNEHVCERERSLVYVSVTKRVYASVLKNLENIIWTKQVNFKSITIYTISQKTRIVRWSRYFDHFKGHLLSRCLYIAQVMVWSITENERKKFKFVFFILLKCIGKCQPSQTSHTRTSTLQAKTWNENSWWKI